MSNKDLKKAIKQKLRKSKQTRKELVKNFSNNDNRVAVSSMTKATTPTLIANSMKPKND